MVVTSGVMSKKGTATSLRISAVSPFGGIKATINIRIKAMTIPVNNQYHIFFPFWQFFTRSPKIPPKQAKISRVLIPPIEPLPPILYRYRELMIAAIIALTGPPIKPAIVMGIWRKSKKRSSTIMKLSIMTNIVIRPNITPRMY